MPVELPDWLEAMIDRVATTGGWPNGKFPAFADEAGCRLGEHFVDGDAHMSLLQCLIDEVERLREVLEPFAAVGRDVPSDWPNGCALSFQPYDSGHAYLAFESCNSDSRCPTIQRWRKAADATA
jgi:hypothetical protein